MAISDIYTIDSGMVTVSSASATAVMELRTAATKRAFVVGARMKIGVTTAVAGNDVVFSLQRAGNSPTGGTGVNRNPQDAASAASISTAFIGSWTIAPTTGLILAEWVLPQTTGSMWEEFPPLGYEWVAGVSTSLVMWVTNSVATATPVECQLIFSE